MTAGNAAGLNDAAAAVVLMERERGAARLQALARLVAYAPCRRGAEVHGHRPGAGGARRAQEGGLAVEDLDVIELNEAFAAQALAVMRELELPARGRIPTAAVSRSATRSAPRAHSHREGAARAAAHRGRYALVTMCIGGGQGIAAIFERL